MRQFLASLFGRSKVPARNQPRFRPALENLEQRDVMSGSPFGQTAFAQFSSAFGGDIAQYVGPGWANFFNNYDETAAAGLGGPGLDYGPRAAFDEVAYQQQFYRDARLGAMQVALATPDNVDLGINAGTLNRATLGWQQAIAGYNQNWYDIGNRTTNAATNYSQFGIRGYDWYGDGYGQQHLLPGGPVAYHFGPYGYQYAGTSPYGYNLFPGW